jgi:hypothetical protein
METRVIKLHVDFNERELLREGVETTVIELNGRNSKTRSENLHEGEKVILYDSSMECEAILRHGHDHEWVADIVPGSIRDLPQEQ